jgi:(S)-ureidoglycine aminohydrolase
MNELFGFTRTVVKPRYALLAPDGFVAGHLPGWEEAIAVVNISPALGAHFSQLQITLGERGNGRGSTGTLENVIYVLGGECAAKLGGKRFNLVQGSFAFVPPQTECYFDSAAKETRLLIFQKKYVPLAGRAVPFTIVGHEKDVPGQPFLGDPDARLQVLLPEGLEFDLAVNIFTYQSGATLPMVESHVMEHGLLMLKGQGIYRLDADWHPVREGDVIWMAPFCPQWFTAMGKTPASYIYYKDVNRAPMGE